MAVGSSEPRLDTDAAIVGYGLCLLDAKRKWRVSQPLSRHSLLPKAFAQLVTVPHAFLEGWQFVRGNQRRRCVVLWQAFVTGLFLRVVAASNCQLVEQSLQGFETVLVAIESSASERTISSESPILVRALGNPHGPNHIAIDSDQVPSYGTGPSILCPCRNRVP
jgi:hypothetical protein